MHNKKKAKQCTNPLRDFSLKQILDLQNFDIADTQKRQIDKKIIVRKQKFGRSPSSYR